MSTLIIRDELINPPTEFSPFRDLTLYCNVFYKFDIVIESDDPDPYVRYMRPRGGMDFVAEFVGTGKEKGIRLDKYRHYPRTVVTDRITAFNLGKLLLRIRFCEN